MKLAVSYLLRSKGQLVRSHAEVFPNTAPTAWHSDTGGAGRIMAALRIWLVGASGLAALPLFRSGIAHTLLFIENQLRILHVQTRHGGS